MPLLTAHDLSKSFGATDIFTSVSISIPHRARIGLVGANGIGKTTLLRILAGLDESSGGAVHQARNVRIGFLPQEAVLDSSLTLWEEELSVFQSLVDTQKELHKLEERLSNEGESVSLLAEYGKLQSAFDNAGGYTFETKLRMTLIGLGFLKADFNRPVTQLSGGQRTRALLAKLLLSQPDLLLLDEPTNHLDIEAVEWLEDFFKDWPGGVLIVSHDRYFLDRVVDHIWEMTPAVDEFRGNYSAYLLQRQERYENRIKEYQAQQEFIEKEEEYIRRNMAGQNTRQAQGRLKRLERMFEDSLLIRPTKKRGLHINLAASNRSGDRVLQTRNLSVGYADEGQALFDVPNLILERTECAAIIGPNGAGKTTFLKTILETIPPLAGEVVLGGSLSVGYFAQAHEKLHPSWTLIEEVQGIRPKMLPAEARDYLAKFLFTGDDVFKLVEVLSGGERGRLALACLALQGTNLLLLDEPTNHLDLQAQEILQQVLQEYPGTILLVSHDRYLIDGLATQIWEVIPSKRTLVQFNGTYSEYRAYKQQLAAGSTKTPAPTIATPRVQNTSGMSKSEKAKIERRITHIETEVAELEREMKTLENALANPPADPGKVQQMGSKYTSLQGKIEDLMQEWTSEHIRLEENGNTNN
jgi:ATP-binding cassette, subfamily F, member 3